MFNNILLSIVAIILAIILLPIGFLYGIFYIIFAYDNKIKVKYISNFFRSIALAIDQLGNVICQHLFNTIFIKMDGVKFGNIDETVSSVLGKNKKLGTLSKLGITLDNILNFFEEDHSIKSIEDDIF